jgi:hypothetical protein
VPPLTWSIDYAASATDRSDNVRYYWVGQVTFSRDLTRDGQTISAMTETMVCRGDAGGM